MVSRGFAMTARSLKFAACLIAAASPMMASAVAAQSAPGSDYDRGYQAGRADAARADQGSNYAQQPDNNDPGQGGYNQAGDNDAPPPPNYDGTQPPPPPPGYQPDPAYAANGAQDQRYEAYAEDWAQRNCFKASNGNTAGGAVIGGLLGALVGSSVAGYHDRGAGALVGGIAGAAGGAAVGNARD